MRLLSGVGADVASLVFKTVKGLVAERALVWPGQVLARLIVTLLSGVLEQRSHEAHGSGSHGGVVVRCGRMLMLLVFSGGLRVEEVVKTQVRGVG